MWFIFWIFSITTNTIAWTCYQGIIVPSDVYFDCYIPTIFPFLPPKKTLNPTAKWQLRPTNVEGNRPDGGSNALPCHVFVKGSLMHVIDIPPVDCMTRPPTPLSIKLSHFPLLSLRRLSATGHIRRVDQSRTATDIVPLIASEETLWV